MTRKRLSVTSVFVATFYLSSTVFFSVSDAFELLPYVHIDYVHYARLAQCQAKCAQTYGTLSRRRLNDGSQRPYINTSSEHYEVCETGCVVHSRGSSPTAAQKDLSINVDNNLDASLFDALRRGQNFWWESVMAQNVADSGQLPTTKIDEKSRKTARLFDGIRVLCIQRSTDEDKRSHTSQASKSFISQAGNIFRTRFGLPSSSKSAQNTPSYRRSLTNAIKRRQLVFIDAYDAVLSAQFVERDSDIKNDNVQAIIRNSARYIVLWRQKAKISIGEIIDRNNDNATSVDNGGGDESTTGWITAAIEASSTFRVEGIQLGMLYRFMLVPIIADGRPKDYGTPIKSDWIDFQTLIISQRSRKQAPASLHFFSHFNAHKQVSAVARWFTFDDKRRLSPDQLTSSTTINTSLSEDDDNTTDHLEYIRQMRHSESTPRRRLTNQRALIFDGCQLQIEYWNKTSVIIDVFDIDESDGIALRNLAFASEYTVKIQSAVEHNNRDSINKNIETRNDSIKADALTGTFTSLSCAQVHGTGSMECDPEPVRNVAVQINDKNESFVTVTWTPAADARHTLLYQLYFAPIIASSGSCTVPPTSLFLTANTTEAQFGLPFTIAEECTFDLRITNYDLLGRDASATVQFTYTPLSRQSSITYSADRVIADVVLPWFREQGRTLRQHAAIAALISVVIAVLIIAIVLIILTARRNAVKRRVWFRRWRTPSTSASTTASASSLPSSTVAVIDEKDLSVRVIVEV